MSNRSTAKLQDAATILLAGTVLGIFLFALRVQYLVRPPLGGSFEDRLKWSQSVSQFWLGEAMGLEEPTWQVRLQALWAVGVVDGGQHWLITRQRLLDMENQIRCQEDFDSWLTVVLGYSCYVEVWPISDLEGLRRRYHTRLSEVQAFQLNERIALNGFRLNRQLSTSSLKQASEQACRLGSNVMDCSRGSGKGHTINPDLVWTEYFLVLTSRQQASEYRRLKSLCVDTGRSEQLAGAFCQTVASQKSDRVSLQQRADRLQARLESGPDVPPTDPDQEVLLP